MPGSIQTGTLRIATHSNPHTALGLAVNHLMVKPAFADLRFGEWSRILVGQINRGHYRFALDQADGIQGLMGWALAPEELAERWLEGSRSLSFAESQDGDCIIFNAWSANSNSVTRVLMAEARRIASTRKAAYFKRHYRDGTIRRARVAVNEFVESHIKRSVAALQANGV